MPKEIIHLRKVTESDLQLMRSWRNSDHVRLNMLNQDLISPEQQLRWFTNSKISGEHHFIYTHGFHDVGVVSIKPSPVPRVFEAGIYCGRHDYLGSSINIAAALWLYDYGFQLPGDNRFKARVLRANTAALRMNESLGYELVGDYGEDTVELELTRAKFEISKGKLAHFVPWTWSI